MDKLNKLVKKLSITLVLSLVLSLLLPSILPMVQTVKSAEAATVKINKKTLTLNVGDTTALKVNGATKTVKWTSSDKEIATVSSNGKVKAISIGEAVITAKVGTTKYTCTVTVQSTRYEEDSYKVGKDIPAGEYVIFAESSTSGYFSVSSDSTGDSIIVNDNFEYNTIITIKDGTYLELSRCYAIPFDEAKVDTSGEGMFKVGTHIDAGEYKLQCNSDTSAYMSVSTDSTHDSIVTNDNFDNSKYITVEEGQYLTISRCKIKE